MDYSELVKQAREREDLSGLGMVNLVDAVRRKELLLAGLADAVEQQADEHNDECAVFGQTIMDAHAERDEGREVASNLTTENLRLEARVAELEAEVRALRRQVASLKGQVVHGKQVEARLEQRVATLEAGIREVVGWGVMSDAKATHSKRVVNSLRALLGSGEGDTE